MKDEVISSTTEDLNENKEDLEGKKSELAEITAETEKKEITLAVY